jgi:hypothetical protein
MEAVATVWIWNGDTRPKPVASGEVRVVEKVLLRTGRIGAALAMDGVEMAVAS